MAEWCVSLVESRVNSSPMSLCYYSNTSKRLHILRSANIHTWYFERVVFPGQRILFEAPPAALLEIHSTDNITAILSDRISCDRLKVDQASSFADNRSFVTNKLEKLV